MTVKDRLLAFLEYLEIGQTKFETAVGFSRGQISKMKKGVSTESLNKISNKFPELNTEWLLTGEGEMIKAVAAPFNADDPLNVERAKIVALQQELAMLKSMFYESQGKHRSYEECLDDIDNGTTKALADLRRSGKKG